MSSNQNPKSIPNRIPALPTVVVLDPVLAPLAPGSNDNAHPVAIPAAPLSHPRPREAAALAAHPEVVRAVRGTLFRLGVRPEDLDDGVAEVQVRALQAIRKGSHPADVGGWKALACTIATRMVGQDARRHDRRSRYDAGSTDEADESAPLPPSPGKQRERLDLLAQLEVLRGQLDAGEMGEHGEAILLMTAEGHGNAHIARQLGITASAVKNRVRRMRKAFTAKLVERGLVDPQDENRHGTARPKARESN